MDARPTPRRSPSGSIALALLLVTGLLPAAAPVDDLLPAPRHIVTCMTDDQGWGEVGYYDHPRLETPELDARAAAGLRLDRFYAASPVCSPTRAGALTGIHPERFGVASWGYDLPAEAVTTAEVLGAAGWTTGHFGKWHLGGLAAAPGKADRHNRAHLIEDERNGREADRHPGGQGFERWLSAPNFYDISDSHLLVDQGRPSPQRDEDTADVLVTEALAFIRQAAAAGRSSFTVIWFPSPHRPYEALPADRAPYGDDALDLRLAEIAAVDRAMGRLRAGLRETGIADDTLLWFCSDNGCAEDYPGGTGGLRDKKGSTWEGGIRVPGIIEWPAVIAAGRHSAVPTSVLDIHPTILGLCDLVIPENLDGIDLRPLLRDKLEARPRPLTFVYRGHAAIIDNALKLHQRQDGQVLLIDLVADPGEQSDIGDEQPVIRDALAARLAAWRTAAERQAATYRRAKE